MAGGHAPRVLTIAAGLPFLRLLAKSLCDGSLTERYRYDPDDPLSLAKVTILVPTRRAARVLRSEFVDILGGRSAILPIIRALGETDDDSGFFDVESPTLFDLAPPINNTVRLLELARLVLAWRNQLPEVIRSIHADTPLVAPASPADAVWLARSLVELIDAVETEEADWEDLKNLDSGDFASWWQLSLQFLTIASQYWPARLDELGRSSPARHRNALLRSEAHRISELDDGDPIIVAGSTGSIPAAAELIAAVASLPQGVVVIPGLDLAMPDETWQQVGAIALAGEFGDPAARGHPQFGLFQLLSRLRLSRDEVVPLDVSVAPLVHRAEIISRAMAPAAATDSWTAWRDGYDPAHFEAAFSDVSLIETANEREEAVSIAIALRLALEETGAHGESSAALITPDRNLARRVTAELARFGIIADDTAGTPFSATPQGTLVQLLLEATLRPGDPVAIVALLKHPLCRLGLDSDRYQAAVAALELIALRGGVTSVDIGALESLFDRQLESDVKDRHRPQWRQTLTETALADGRLLAGLIATAVEPLAGAMLGRRASGGVLSDRLPLCDWAERTGRVLEALTRDASGGLVALWADEAGDSLANLLGEVMQADEQIDADGPQWIDIVTALTAGTAIKPKAMRHPRVFIFGTLEARLQSVDTLVIGGLNEGAWPGQTTNNPFLSRTMKTQIGLEPPEYRIGQLAHDFEMANGTRRLIYSRSLRQGSAPTVASRWLQRLLALAGPDFADRLRARGDRYRHYAGLIDQAESQKPAQRPAPKPPMVLQPTRYSFSEVGRLRRDPYAIYARRILRLDPVDAFNQDPSAAERGTIYHRVVERFIALGLSPLSPEAAPAMRRIISEVFDDAALPPHIDIVWRLRFHDVAKALLRWEADRYPAIKQTLTEVPARMDITSAGIMLTGVADRIDVRAAGFADIVDYKTGISPSAKQARTLLDPQLALEAAALKAGAFARVGSLTPENLLYVRLRPGERFKVDQVNNELTAKGDSARSATDLAEQSIAELTRFVLLLQSGEKGFVSRLMPAQLTEYGGEYDHLARVAEWSSAEAEEVAGDE